MRINLNRKHGVRAVVWAMVLVLGTLVRGQAPAPGGAKTQRLFWKITSPTTEVYFLGSIHMAGKDIYPLPPEIEAAYKSSANLVVEADITKVDQTQMMARVMKDGMYGPGDSLDKHISAETLTAFNNFCKENGMPAEMLLMMKPPIAAMTVESVAVQKLGLAPEDGIDMHFLNQAKEGKDKKVVELESADAQLDLLMGIDGKLGDKWLAETLKDSNKEEVEKVAKAWREGDDKALAAQMAADDGKDADAAKMSDLLIYQRNNEMVKKIDEMLKGKEKVFVVVGAAHLVGDKGVLKQLEAKNYKVERPVLTMPAAKTGTP